MRELQQMEGAAAAETPRWKSWLLPQQQSEGSSRKSFSRRLSSRGDPQASKVGTSHTSIEQVSSALLALIEHEPPLRPQQRLATLWAICRNFQPLLRCDHSVVFKARAARPDDPPVPAAPLHRPHRAPPRSTRARANSRSSRSSAASPARRAAAAAA